MEKFEIERDNGAALAFNGELIAKVSSSDNNASGSSYSGQTGRWQVLALYKTEGGKLICEESTAHAGKVSATRITPRYASVTKR